MAWRSIFDLGDVDLFFCAGIDLVLQPLSALPSGTVTVVNGVIQCRDLPENYNGAGVGRIVAIPRGAPAQAVPYRMTFANAAIPRVSEFSQSFSGGASYDTASDGSVNGSEADTTYNWNGVVGAVDTADFVPNPALGTYTPLAAPNDGVLVFNYSEAEA